MGPKAKSTAALLALMVWSCHVTAFSVKRKSSARSDLSPALKVLERQKRQSPDMDYLYPARSRAQQLPQFGLWDRGEDENLWMNALSEVPRFRDEYKPNYDEIPPSSGFESSLQAIQPSKEEIENIFSDEQDSDRDASVNVRKKSYASEEDFKQKKAKEILNPLSPLPPKVKKSSSSSENDGKINLDNLTKEEINILANVVEKLKKQTEAEAEKILEESQSPDAEETVSVSDKELAQMFENAPSVTEEETTKTVTVSGDGRPTVQEETVTEENEGTAEDDVNDLERRNGVETLNPEDEYWLLDRYINDKRKKRAPAKRSPDSFPLEETYLSEIERLQREVQTLRLVAQLEDIENDALTKSLNEATLSQREGTVSEKEFSGLKEAINVEEALQAIKSGALDADDLDELVSLSGSKRGEPLYKKESKKSADVEESYARRRRKWLEGPVAESVSKKKRDFVDVQDTIEKMANEFPSSLELSDKHSDEDNEYPETRLSTEETNNPNYLLGLNYADRPSETAVELYPSKNSDNGECPAADRLISDCEFADSYGLPIDQEARALCNRHELCYACGGTTSLAPGQCDNFYRADAALLCDDDEDCVLQAELFLRTLKLKHRYNQYSVAVCRDSCVNSILGITY